MDVEIGPKGQIARVRHVSDDDLDLHLEFESGAIAKSTASEPVSFVEGDTVLVESGGGSIALAPDEMWTGDDPWVGVVRIRLDDVSVIDQSGRLHYLETEGEVSYRPGNTVLVQEGRGVIRVLDEKPIRLLDVATVDEEVIAGFKVDLSQATETFEDFGGMKDVVQRAHELVELPLKHREALEEIGARAIKGVLFTGLPGTGKTMLARIIASQAKATFYEISGPEVFSKWYGESEEILRKLFEEAADQERSIIFFDEIDSVAGHRDEGAHEASKRVVAQLLTLMDGFTAADNVVVIATTNRPQDIDVALRRPGRFDWEINFRLPTASDREAILRASSRGLKTAEELPFERVAAATEGWAAADLAAIWSEAALLSVADGRSRILAEDFLGGFDRVGEQHARSTETTQRTGS